MERITLTIPAELWVRLRRLAAERATSMASLVREAIDEKLAGVRPHPRSLGVGSSKASDTTRRSANERPAPRSWR